MDIKIKEADNGYVLEAEGKVYIAKSYLELGRKIVMLFGNKINKKGVKK